MKNLREEMGRGSSRKKDNLTKPDFQSERMYNSNHNMEYYQKALSNIYTNHKIIIQKKLRSTFRPFMVEKMLKNI